MTISLPELPFARDALVPHISAETVDYHYGKHHAAYVTNLNNLIAGTAFADKTLEDIIMQAAGKPESVGVFNNAAQVWNHTFYWHCMRANGGGEPSGVVRERIERDFGSFDAFKKAFKEACVTQFGSGWGFLVVDEAGKLSIMKTSNADTPMVHGKKALLTCDVWEHAYYIDYRNRRPDYVEVFLNHLVNWDFVAHCLA